MQLIRKQDGFTLIELMVSLVLGLLVTGIVIALFAHSKRNFNEDEQVSLMQENGRFAMQLMSRDISMAGFLGNLFQPTEVDASGITLVGNCISDWSQVVDLPPIKVTPESHAPAACFTSETIKPGTQVVVIKRAEPVFTNSPVDGKLYFRTNGTGGSLYIGSTTTPAGYRDWEYIMHVYYIKVDNGIPALYRKRLAPSAGTNVSLSAGEQLIPGVESFAISLGVDTTGDGIANTYYPSTTSAVLSNAVSAKLDILVRSTRLNPSYTNNKTYYVGNTVINGTDFKQYYGRVFSTTIPMRNIAYRIQN